MTCAVALPRFRFRLEGRYLHRLYELSFNIAAKEINYFTFKTAACRLL